MEKTKTVICEQECHNKNKECCSGCVHNAAILAGQVKGDFLE